jgi:hypothetical protein
MEENGACMGGNATIQGTKNLKLSIFIVFEWIGVL